MDKIPGWPFLQKALPKGQLRTPFDCSHCGERVFLEESIWENEHTNEQYIWCGACKGFLGMTKDLPLTKTPAELPDST